MSTESEKLAEERAELERERKQVTALLKEFSEKMTQLEEAPKTFRDFIQGIADSVELRVKSEEVLEAMRFFVFQAIHRFQVVPTLEEAINAYANLLFFVQDIIPPGTFVKHSARLEKITEENYGKYWKEPIKLGRSIRVSRIVMPDLYHYFYEIVHYLLRLRFLTAEDAEKTYVSFQASTEEAMRKYGASQDE